MAINRNVPPLLLVPSDQQPRCNALVICYSVYGTCMAEDHALMQDTFWCSSTARDSSSTHDSMFVSAALMTLLFATDAHFDVQH